MYLEWWLSGKLKNKLPFINHSTQLFNTGKYSVMNRIKKWIDNDKVFFFFLSSGG